MRSRGPDYEEKDSVRMVFDRLKIRQNQVEARRRRKYISPVGAPDQFQAQNKYMTGI